MADLDTPPNAGAPYRKEADELRYLCTVCYRSASTAPATCPRCDAPMLPLDNPEVVMMARKRVAAQMARKRTQLAAVGLVVGFGVSAVICLALGLPLVDAGLKFGQYGSYLVSIGLVLTVVWWFITWRLLTSPSDTAPVGELLRRLRIEPLCRHVTAEGRR